MTFKIWHIIIQKRHYTTPNNNIKSALSQYMNSQKPEENILHTYKNICYINRMQDIFTTLLVPKWI